MLEKQNMNIALAKGLDTKSDPKQEPVGFFLTLQNVVFKTINELRKRFGFTVLSNSILGGSTVSTGVQVSTYASELVQSDAASLYSYSPTALKQINRGVMPIVNLTTTPIDKSSNYHFGPDSAYLSGYYVYIWQFTPSTTNLYYSVVDAVTGVHVISAGLVATAINGGTYRVVPLGTNFVIFYSSAANDISYKTIAVATPQTLSGATSIASNLNSTYTVFDVYINSAVAERAYISYINSSGTAGISNYYLSTALALSSVYVITGTSQRTIGIFGDASGNTWIGGYDGTNTVIYVVNAALNATTLAKTTVDAALESIGFIGSISGTTATFYFEIPSGTFSYYNYIKKNTCTLAGTAGTSAVFLRNNGIASKVFTYSSINYFAAIHESPLQPTYFVIRDDAYCVARFAQGVGGYVQGLGGYVAAVNTVSSGVFQLAFLESSINTVTGGVIYPLKGVSSATITINSATTSTQELGANLHFTGGMLQMYDGNAPCEHGFHLSPESVTATPGTSGSMTAGVYSVKCTYEWVDAQGQIHRSAPSTGTSFTIGAITNGSVSVTCPMLPITSKSGRVSIMAYQTLPNGTVYYCAFGTIFTGILNVTTTASVTFVLTAPDYSGNALLYTTGGEVDNDPLGSSSAIATFKSRMVANVTGNPLQYAYSKQVITGSPVEFSADFIGNIDSKIGSFTAGASLDGNFIFFGPQNLFYMVGDGPSPNGTNNDFTTPQLVSSDVGCTNQASIVSMPKGLMFQSPAKGIYLLDRSLQVSYIGAPVEGFNSYNVTSAVLVKNQNHVRFTLSNGTCLYYDYFVNQWDDSTNISAIGATIWNSSYVYLTSAGIENTESTTLYTDNGSGVNMTFKTSWVSLAGVQGYQRVKRLYLLGDWISSHTLTINLYFDYSTTIGQTVTIPVTSDPAPYEFRVPIDQQKCTALQVEIIESGSSGEGFRLSNLAVEVGIKKGLNKLPAANTYGG